MPGTFRPEETLILITGASRGLGRQLAFAFAGRGYRLALLARDRKSLRSLSESLAEACRCEPGIFAYDLSHADAAHRCIQEIRQRMGRVDVLVNNAGVGWYKPFTDHTVAEHELMIDVNFRAAVHLTHEVLPGMLEARRGHIINIASDLADRPLANMSVYTATKHAMRGFSLSLSREVRPRGIKVSLVNPGMIDTAFHGSGEGTLDEAGALKPGPLAELVVQVLEQPGHQLVDEITVHAMMQDY